MEVIIRSNAEAATDLVARVIAKELRDNPCLLARRDAPLIETLQRIH
jgi:hypothetical protein